MLTDNKQGAIGTSCATEIHTAGVFILTTCVQGSLMAAHATRESAMAAAVEFVQGEAETRLSGSLAERYEKARRFVEGQGGQMEVIRSPLFSQPIDLPTGD